mgnify:CR=1 FL=1
MIGSMFAFFLGRVFGVKLLIWMVGPKAYNKYQKMLKGRDKLMLFMMFLLPVFPDDLLCIFAGVTTMSYTTFFIINDSVAYQILYIAIQFFFVNCKVQFVCTKMLCYYLYKPIFKLVTVFPQANKHCNNCSTYNNPNQNSPPSCKWNLRHNV